MEKKIKIDEPELRNPNNSPKVRSQSGGWVPSVRDGKDLRKNWVLSLEWKDEELMDRKVMRIKVMNWRVQNEMNVKIIVA